LSATHTASLSTAHAPARSAEAAASRHVKIRGRKCLREKGVEHGVDFTYNPVEDAHAGSCEVSGQRTADAGADEDIHIRFLHKIDSLKRAQIRERYQTGLVHLSILQVSDEKECGRVKDRRNAVTEFWYGYSHVTLC